MLHAIFEEILIPIGWLVFSLTFARLNTRDVLEHWKGGLSDVRLHLRRRAVC
jgi:hypothetical protein